MIGELQVSDETRAAMNRLNGGDMRRVLVGLATTAIVAREMTGHPFPAGLSFLQTGSAAVFITVSLEGLSADYGVPFQALLEVFTELCGHAQKTEVEKPAAHEGPEGPTQS